MGGAGINMPLEIVNVMNVRPKIEVPMAGLRHINVEGVASEPDQGHQELHDHDGPADGGTDQK
jgi:hypothetical protein